MKTQSLDLLPQISKTTKKNSSFFLLPSSFSLQLLNMDLFFRTEAHGTCSLLGFAYLSAEPSNFP